MEPEGKRKKRRSANSLYVQKKEEGRVSGVLLVRPSTLGGIELY